MQTLANSDRFVGWGSQPNLTEFSPDGRVLFDAALAPPVTSYRAYRFPWSANPPGRPAIAAATATRDRLMVYASWNGATDVARWRILTGASPSTLRPTTEVADTGFETATTLFTAAEYVAVQAQDQAGRVLGTSSTIMRGA